MGLLRLADTVKGGELSYAALAMEREQTAFNSPLTLAGVVLANSKPIPVRLARGYIALFLCCAVNGGHAHAWVL